VEYLDGLAGPVPLHEVEAKLLVFAFAIALAALGRYLAGIGVGNVGPVHVDPEGRKRRRIGVRRLTYRSLFGKLVVWRTYYHDAEHGGFCPLDAQLAVPETGYSYHLQKYACILEAQNAYGEGVTTLEALTGMHMPKSMGEHILAEAAAFVPGYRESAPPPANEGEVLVVMGDAKGIPMIRPVVKAPPGPPLSTKPEQRQGKKKMANSWTIYTMNPQEGEPPVPLNRTTCGHLGTKREAFELLAADAARRGAGAKKMLFLCDGDQDLVALQREYFPNALCCLDWMHLQEYVWEGAYVFHPKGSKEAEAWVKEKNERLMKDDVATVLRGLRQSLTKGKAKLTTAQQETLERVIGYMDANKDRMPYGSFMLAGYPIGTGSIEGGVRHLIGDRMDRTGMRWSESGAQAMLHVRSIHINGEMAAFHDERIKREQRRMYGSLSVFAA
jgi:hypothetical protein